MLAELRLRNLAVAEDVTVRLGSGLNVLSGSTGAGKSLVTDALQWLAGATIDRQLLRADADLASAEAVFDLSDRPDLIQRLTDIGVDCGEDACLVLRRELRAEGRSRALVNGAIASAALLQRIHEQLFELQSQHQQLVLLDPNSHIEILNSMSASGDHIASWKRTYDEFLAVQREVTAVLDRQEQLREQRELLEYQRDELQHAGLRSGELEELRRRVARLEGGARLMELVHSALARLDDDDSGVRAGLGEAAAHLSRLPEGFDELSNAREQLESASDLIAEAARTLEGFLAEGEYDPRELGQSQDRLGFLIDLTRKYSRTEAELLRRLEQLDADLSTLTADGSIPESLARRRDVALASLQSQAKSLQKRWKADATKMARGATPLLEELGMPGAALRFDFLLDESPDGQVKLDGRNVEVTREGPVKVRLVARTNPGERFGPVERIASGGELSRIGLALRSVATAPSHRAMLLLDEVDAGLGADLGPALARRVKALSEGRQTLVITHLPAVAAAADVHLVATKSADQGRTRSSIKAVAGESRIDELTRMLGDHGAADREAAASLLRATAGEASA